MSETPRRAPDAVDAWRMVAAGRRFEGTLALADLPRLRESLCEPQGAARYVASFGTGPTGVPEVRLQVDAALPLACQRSLRRFELPVRLELALGLLRDEAEEAALPPGHEPLLVPADGQLRLADLVEDELILALPVVPVAPDAEAVERTFGPSAEDTARTGPFAALAGWKKE